MSRTRMMQAVRHASLPPRSGCCGKPRGCTMTHQGCRCLADPWKRAAIYHDPAVQCQKTSIAPHPKTGQPVGSQCELRNGHAPPCEVRPVTGA